METLNLIKSLIALSLIFVLSACSAVQTFQEPPRVLTQTAVSQSPPTPTPEPILVAAPTATAQPADTAIAAANNNEESLPTLDTLTIWVDQTSPAHAALLDETAAIYSEQLNVTFQTVLVNPEQIQTLMQTAVTNNTLPDLIISSGDLIGGWLEDGVLDPQAAQEVVNNLGANTFNQNALDWATKNGQLIAIPHTGWQQLLVYRQDWFNELNLAPPTNFGDIVGASSAIFNSNRIANLTGADNTLIAGFAIPTEPNQIETQHGFEHLANANGCELIDERGEVVIDSSICIDTFRFWRETIFAYSPPNLQTPLSGLNAYLNGRVGMMMVSPRALPALAGLSSESPLTCSECQQNPNYLIENSGIVTTLAGDSSNAQAVNFSDLEFLGITTGANRETAVSFATSWYNDIYPRWIAIEPETNAPLRHGTQSNPTAFLDAWQTLPLANTPDASITSLFGTDTANLLLNDLAKPTRWGIANEQLSLLTRIVEKNTVASLLQRLLLGYFDPTETAVEMHERITNRIPDYIFAPTPTPEPN